jgi:methionyl-tRNA synthetase
MADDLLNYYTAEQLRAHFLGFGVSYNNASFMPKPFNPDAKPTDMDPVIREGNLLTNVFNRIARTIFYTVWQKYGGLVPDLNTELNVKDEAKNVIFEYERLLRANVSYDN